MLVSTAIFCWFTVIAVKNVNHEGKVTERCDEFYSWFTEYVEDSAGVSLTPPLRCLQGIEHVQQCKTVEQIFPDNEGPTCPIAINCVIIDIL